MLRDISAACLDITRTSSARARQCQGFVRRLPAAPREGAYSRHEVGGARPRAPRLGRGACSGRSAGAVPAGAERGTSRSPGNGVRAPGASPRGRAHLGGRVLQVDAGVTTRHVRLPLQAGRRRVLPDAASGRGRSPGKQGVDRARVGSAARLRRSRPLVAQRDSDEGGQGCDGGAGRADRPHLRESPRRSAKVGHEPAGCDWLRTQVRQTARAPYEEGRYCGKAPIPGRPGIVQVTAAAWPSETRTGEMEGRPDAGEGRGGSIPPLGIAAMGNATSGPRSSIGESRACCRRVFRKAGEAASENLRASGQRHERRGRAHREPVSPHLCAALPQR